MTSDKLNLSKDEKAVYVQCLNYIFNLNKKNTNESRKKFFIECNMREMGISYDEIKDIKTIKKSESLADELKSLSKLKTRKYILREMILLAIVDHELTDNEITSIYEIGIRSGIKEEMISSFFLWAAKGVEWQIEGMKLIEEDI